MNDDFSTATPDGTRPHERMAASVGSSTLLNLLEAMIQLTERNKAEHKLFAQDLKAIRDSMQGSFNNFASETQKAYQHLRKEVHGEKRVSLALLNELLDAGLDLEHVAQARPRIGDGMTAEEIQALTRWAEAVEVQSRKVQAALHKHGIHPYDAVIGSAYNPA